MCGFLACEQVDSAQGSLGRSHMYIYIYIYIGQADFAQGSPTLQPVVCACEQTAGTRTLAYIYIYIYIYICEHSRDAWRNPREQKKTCGQAAESWPVLSMLMIAITIAIKHINNDNINNNKISNSHIDSNRSCNSNSSFFIVLYCLFVVYSFVNY